MFSRILRNFVLCVLFCFVCLFACLFFKESNIESAEISWEGLHITHLWQMNYEVFVKFSKKFNKFEILMIKFTLKYFFHIFVCGSQI